LYRLTGISCNRESHTFQDTQTTRQ